MGYLSNCSNTLKQDCASLFETIDDSDNSTFEKLVEKHNCLTSTRDGNSLLMYAICRDTMNRSIVNSLLSNVLIFNEGENCEITCAIEHFHSEILEILLERIDLEYISYENYKYYMHLAIILSNDVALDILHHKNPKFQLSAEDNAEIWRLAVDQANISEAIDNSSLEWPEKTNNDIAGALEICKFLVTEKIISTDEDLVTYAVEQGLERHRFLYYFLSEIFPDCTNSDIINYELLMEKVLESLSSELEIVLGHSYLDRRTAIKNSLELVKFLIEKDDLQEFQLVDRLCIINIQLDRNSVEKALLNFSN